MMRTVGARLFYSEVKPAPDRKDGTMQMLYGSSCEGYFVL